MNATRNWAAALACMLGMLTGGAQGAGERLAYVANFESNTVSVIDTATHA